MSENVLKRYFDSAWFEFSDFEIGEAQKSSRGILLLPGRYLMLIFDDTRQHWLPTVG